MRLFKPVIKTAWQEKPSVQVESGPPVAPEEDVIPAKEDEVQSIPHDKEGGKEEQHEEQREDKPAPEVPSGVEESNTRPAEASNEAESEVAPPPASAKEEAEAPGTESKPAEEDEYPAKENVVQGEEGSAEKVSEPIASETEAVPVKTDGPAQLSPPETGLKAKDQPKVEDKPAPTPEVPLREEESNTRPAEASNEAESEVAAAESKQPEAPSPKSDGPAQHSPPHVELKAEAQPTLEDKRAKVPEVPSTKEESNARIVEASKAAESDVVPVTNTGISESSSKEEAHSMKEDRTQKDDALVKEKSVEGKEALHTSRQGEEASRTAAEAEKSLQGSSTTKVTQAAESSDARGVQARQGGATRLREVTLQEQASEERLWEVPFFLHRK